MMQSFFDLKLEFNIPNTVFNPQPKVTSSVLSIIPKENLGKAASFIKFGLRKGQALALVNAASALWVEGNKFKDVRIALGAVAPVVMRATKAEALLEGQIISEDLVQEAAKIAVGEAKPIDDFRASKEYRNDLIEVGTRRTLQAALTASSIKN